MTKKQVKDSARPAGGGVPRPKKVGSRVPTVPSAKKRTATRVPTRSRAGASAYEHRPPIGVAFWCDELVHVFSIDSPRWHFPLTGAIEICRCQCYDDLGRRCTIWPEKRHVIQYPYHIATGIGAAPKVAPAKQSRSRAKPGSAKRKAPKQRKQTRHAH